MVEENIAGLRTFAQKQGAAKSRFWNRELIQYGFPNNIILEMFLMSNIDQKLYF